MLVYSTAKTRIRGKNEEGIGDEVSKEAKLHNEQPQVIFQYYCSI